MDVELLFGDIVALSNQNWCGPSDTKGAAVEVPAVNLFTAGFECDTVSRLNQWCSPAAQSSCVEHAAGKTGTTCRATLQYIVEKSPGVPQG
jgi:hypothetical protein